MEKVAKRESYERFWGYNKIKKWYIQFIL
jgi:hypothetical protein